MTSSILNHQSITPPIGHGVGKTGSSARSPEGSQNLLPITISLPGSNSHKSSHQMHTLKPNYSMTSVVEAGPPWLFKEAADHGVPVDASGLPSSSGGLSPLRSSLVGSNEDHTDTHRALRGDPVADLLGEYNLFSAGLGATLAVTVSSAVELDQRQIDQIRRKMQRLTGFKNLRLENCVDPSLIAGFVIRYGSSEDSNFIDLSVKGQLTQLSARIESSENRRVEQEQQWSFLT